MPNDPAAIAAEIDTLRNDLRTVTAAIPVMGKSAETKADEISGAIAKAQEQLAAAFADEAENARQKRLSAFYDIGVDVDYPPNYEGNLLRASFVIHYVKAAWDNRLKRSVPQSHRCNGFQALPADAYEYLVTAKPEAIPADIMALAPGDPQEAFSRYFQGLRRGMFRTASRVDSWAV